MVKGAESLLAVVLVVVGAAAAAVTVAVFLVALAAAFAFVAFFAALAFVIAFTLASAASFAFALAATAAVVTLRIELFFGCFAHRNDFDGEVQVLAGELMVCVDYGGLFAHRLHADGHRAGGRLGIEHHAFDHLVDSLENVQRDFLRHFFVVFAVAFGGDHLDVELVAHVVADHRLFETHDDHVGALNVLQRFAAFGRINDLAFVGGQGVVHLDNGLVGNLHG